jgi:SAM-dependent methyltransferase
LSNKSSTTFYGQTAMGEGWVTNPVLQVQAGLIERRLGGLPSGRILDLGCGHGSNSRVLFGGRQDLDVIGLDVSAKAVAGYLEVRPGLVGDAEHLPFASDSFDLVVSDDVVEHLVDTDGYAREIHRVLKPGGHLALSTPNLAAWFNRISLLMGVQPAYSEVSFEKVFGRPGSDIVGHLRLFTCKSVVQFLEYHGFEVLEVRSAPFGALPTPARQIDKVAAKLPKLGANTVVLARARIC